MLNQCNFIGNLGQDPDIRFTANQSAVANISLGCTHKYKDEQHTEWVRGVAFGKTAEIIGEYLKKGSKVYISGRMQTNKWQDKEGNDRYTTEIIINDMKMLDSKGANQQSTRPQQDSKSETTDELDQKIPF